MVGIRNLSLFGHEDTSKPIKSSNSEEIFDIISEMKNHALSENISFQSYDKEFNSGEIANDNNLKGVVVVGKLDEQWTSELNESLRENGKFLVVVDKQGGNIVVFCDGGEQYTFLDAIPNPSLPSIVSSLVRNENNTITVTLSAVFQHQIHRFLPDKYISFSNTIGKIFKVLSTSDDRTTLIVEDPNNEIELSLPCQIKRDFAQKTVQMSKLSTFTEKVKNGEFKDLIFLKSGWENNTVLFSNEQQYCPTVNTGAAIAAQQVVNFCISIYSPPVNQYYKLSIDSWFHPPAEREKIMEDKLLIILGSGAVGCELLEDLVRAGVKKIVLFDGDKIANTNLHRQKLFHSGNVNEYKAEVAAEALRKINPEISVKTFTNFLTLENVSDYHELFSQAAGFVSAVDNVDARKLLVALSYFYNVPFFDGGTGSLAASTQVVVPHVHSYLSPMQDLLVATAGCIVKQFLTIPEQAVARSKIIFKTLFEDDVDKMTNINQFTPGRIIQMHQLILLDDSERHKQVEDWCKNNLFPLLFVDEIQEFINSVESEDEQEGQPRWNQTTRRKPNITPLNMEDEDHIQFVTSASALILRLNESFKSNGNFTALEICKEDDDIMNFLWATSKILATSYGLLKPSFQTVYLIASNMTSAIVTASAVVGSLMALTILAWIFDKNAKTLPTFSINFANGSFAQRPAVPDDYLVQSFEQIHNGDSISVQQLVNYAIHHLGDNLFGETIDCVQIKSKVLIDPEEQAKLELPLLSGKPSMFWLFASGTSGFEFFIVAKILKQ